jgi:hypothetical protein
LPPQRTPAGNTATSAAFAFTVDTTPPAQPAITGAAYSGGVWNLSGKAATGSTVTIYDGGTKLGTASATSSAGWSFPANENNSAIRDFSVTATDPAGNTSVASADWLEGTPNADVFLFASEAALAGPAAIFGNGGSDTIGLTAPATPADADFAHTHNILTLALTGASTVSLGASATAAGIGAVTTGKGATIIADGNAGTLNVDASALAAGALLTFSGSESFAATGLIGNVAATSVAGALNVTTGTGSLSIATGAGSNNINATALGLNNTLTMTGSTKAIVSTLTGNLAAGSYAGNLTVTATGAGAQTIVTGSGADAVTASHGGDTFVGEKGADAFNVLGHETADTFAYNFVNDSLNLGNYDTITGFMDKGNGGSFNDILDLHNVSGLTTIQGGLNNTNQKVNGNSIAWFYDSTHNQTLVYANTGASSSSQSNTAMLIDLAGGNFHLSATPNVNVIV